MGDDDQSGLQVFRKDDRRHAMTVIELSEQLDDICHRYPEYWRSDKAQRELQTCRPLVVADVCVQVSVQP
jgi:hypothetical protein